LRTIRAIPGTAIEQHMNSIISTIEEDARPAFLKTVLVGVIIRRAVYSLSKPELSAEEK
jgi:hypothetical protein